jgi:hypothetical protein
LIENAGSSAPGTTVLAATLNTMSELNPEGSKWHDNGGAEVET